jgi:hypothetical protein
MHAGPRFVIAHESAQISHESMAATATVPRLAVSSRLNSSADPAAGEGRVAVLVVDADRATALIDDRIYGQFLEHINHSVEDGLFAEQIRGAGFEGEGFQTYWESFERQRLRLNSDSLVSHSGCLSD